MARVPGDGWRRDIDVPAFIDDNGTPYEGDAEFLAGPTDRTGRLWGSLQGRLFAEERRRGIYDVDAHTPSIDHRRTRPATSTATTS